MVLRGNGFSHCAVQATDYADIPLRCLQSKCTIGIGEFARSEVNRARGVQINRVIS
jgi:hypothetical protein